MEKIFWTRWDWTVWEWHHHPWMLAIGPTAFLAIYITLKIKGR